MTKGVASIANYPRRYIITQTEYVLVVLLLPLFAKLWRGIAMLLGTQSSFDEVRVLWLDKQEKTSHSSAQLYETFSAGPLQAASIGTSSATPSQAASTSTGASQSSSASSQSRHGRPKGSIIT
jgi:hypothetical protein